MKKQTKTTTPKDESSGAQSQSVLIEMRVYQAEATTPAGSRCAGRYNGVYDGLRYRLRLYSGARKAVKHATDGNAGRARRERTHCGEIIPDGCPAKEAMANPNVVETGQTPSLNPLPVPLPPAIARRYTKRYHYRCGQLLRRQSDMECR